MTTRTELLAWKRQQLLAESRMQRMELVAQLQPLANNLSSVETGWRILNRVRRHPGWIAAGAIGFILLTPKRLSSWLRVGTSALQTWRRIEPTLRMLTGR